MNVPNLLARGRSTFQLNENRLSLTSQQPDLPDYTKNTRKFTPEVLAFGASTGGTEELARLLSQLPARCPPVLVVQHISPNFSRDFALRLSQVSGLKLGQMQAGEDLREGMIYVPLRDYHIGVRRFGGLLKLVIGDGPAVNRHKPSVDVLFNSLADARVRTFAAILTGMGRDGADGLLRLRTSGAITWAQDERSSAVFGMPKEAIKINAATHVGNPTQIRHHLDNILLAMDRIQVIKKTGS